MKNEEVLLTREDLKGLYRRRRSCMAKVACLFGVITFLWFGCHVPRYCVEATFQQGGFQTSSLQAELAVHMKEMLPPAFSYQQDNGVSAVLHSESLIRGVAEELGLLAQVKVRGRIATAFQHLKEHLCLSLHSTIPDADRFLFQNVYYTGETKQSLILKPKKDGSFELWNQQRAECIEGQLGVPVCFEGVTLTIVGMPREVHRRGEYSLSILPWQEVVQNIKKYLKVRSSRLGKNLLILSYMDRDRHLAASLLNHLMDGYHRYLKKHHDTTCKEQMAYLEGRQKELLAHLDLSLASHASYLKEAVVKEGSLAWAEEAKSIAVLREECIGKLSTIDLEVQRLTTSPQMSFVPVRKSILISSHLSAPLFPDLIGLTLETSKQLFSSYTVERDALQAQCQELRFFQRRLEDPAFELSSIGAVLSDPMINDLLRQASQIALQMQEGYNRTSRDLERLQDALTAQKGFLSQHLLQVLALKTMRCELVDAKISALKQAMLQLLQGEKQLLKQKLQELNRQVEQLPEKWRKENLLLFAKELGIKQLEGLSQLTEAKNISQYLYQAHSRPVYEAFAPLKIGRSSLLPLSLCGALGGACLSYLFSLCVMLLRGIPVSCGQLQQGGYGFSGTLSDRLPRELSLVSDVDLEVFRSIADFIGSQKQGPLSVALLGGTYVNYSTAVAEMLTLRGWKVVLVQCVFDDLVYPEDRPGLWQYLTQEINTLPVKRGKYYDFITAGGNARHAIDYLMCARGQEMIDALKAQYDVVLLYSKTPLGTSVAQALLQCIETAVVAVHEENMDTLASYFKKNTTFIWVKKEF